MFVQGNSINVGVKLTEKTKENIKNIEPKNVSVNAYNNTDNIKIGIQSKNTDSIKTPIKMFDNKIERDQAIFSGTSGAVIALSTAGAAKLGYNLGSNFGIKGAIVGSAVAGISAGIISSGILATVDERIFNNTKSVAIGGAAAGASFAAIHSLKSGADLKSSALLIGAGAIVGAGVAIGTSYSMKSGNKN